MISKILSPAVQLWLRSQLQSAQALQFQIEGGDRQILSGHIPKVTIAAESAVYQGIALSQVSAVGESIRINLTEVLKGKPLRLLDVVPIQAAVQLRESDLNASLQSPLLTHALAGLLKDWLLLSRLAELSDSIDRILSNQPIELHHPQISLRTEQLILSGTLISAAQHTLPFVIGTGLQVVNGARLRLDCPQWLHLQPSQGKLLPNLYPAFTHPSIPPFPPSQGSPLPDLHGYEINLGPEVNIQQLTLQAGQIICRGSINVLP